MVSDVALGALIVIGTLPSMALTCTATLVALVLTTPELDETSCRFCEAVALLPAASVAVTPTALMPLALSASVPLVGVAVAVLTDHAPPVAVVR